MGDFDLVTATDIRLMQGMAQRVTAIRPDLVNSDASFGELASGRPPGTAATSTSWWRHRNFTLHNVHYRRWITVFAADGHSRSPKFTAPQPACPQ